MTGEENLENTDEPTVTEEWVDENIINPEETDDPNDSVTDCCCDKRKTYDNHNYCIKMPKQNLSVSEACAVAKILLEFTEYMPYLSHCYASYSDLNEALNEYIGDCLHVLYDEDCLSNSGDVDFDGNKV